MTHSSAHPPQTVPNALQRAWAWGHSTRAQWVLFPLLVLLLSRAFIFGMGWVADQTVPDDWWRTDAGWEVPPDYYVQGPFTAWMRWDAQRYSVIATQGYDYTPNVYGYGPPGFFPLFPLLTRALMPLFGHNPMTAGTVLSNLCFLAATMLLYRLVLARHNHGVARRTLLYLAFSPAAFHFAIPYTESLFLLLTVGAATFATQRRWLAASLLGALASATRVPGVLVGVLVGVAWLNSHDVRLHRLFTAGTWAAIGRAVRTDARSLLVIVLLNPLGLLAYMGYLGAAFGAPLAFLRVFEANQHSFQGVLGVVGQVITFLRGDYIFPYLVPVGLLTLAWALWMLRRVWRDEPEPEFFYSAFSVAFPIVSGVVTGLLRYTTVLWPLFVVMAVAGRRPAVHRLVLYTFLPLQAVCIALYVKWYLIS